MGWNILFIVNIEAIQNTFPLFHIEWDICWLYLVIVFYSGQSPSEADFNLLDTARKVELYGMQMHNAKVCSLHWAASIFI